MRGARALAAAGTLLMIGTTAIGATAAPAGHGTKNRCANSTKYLFAKSATDYHGVVTITGHSGYFFCAKDAEFIKLRKATITFTTTKAAPIRVLNKPYLNPDATHRIKHGKFPAYVSHRHSGEQYYIWTGPRNAITKLRPGFQS